VPHRRTLTAVRILLGLTATLGSPAITAHEILRGGGPAVVFLLTFPLSAFGGAVLGSESARLRGVSAVPAQFGATALASVVATLAQPLVIWSLLDGTELVALFVTATPVAFGLAVVFTAVVEGVRVLWR
jgi:hypothetical protein